MQPLLLNVDWLAVSVRFVCDNFGALTAGHFYVEFPGTNIWKCRRIVFNEYSEKVATILYAPKSKIIPYNAGLIEVANEWLYHGNSPMRILDMIKQWRKFEVTGLSRVDLAVDFNPTARQWYHIRCLADRRDYVAAKQSRVPWFEVVRSPLLAERYQGLEVPISQTWGHKTTAVRWKLYYKSKELVDACGGKFFAKPYIVDCWEEAGLDKSDVWRLEVSIHGGNTLEFRDCLVTLEQIKHNPREIYAALYTRRFIVRRNEKHKDKTNDRRVEFLPIGATTALKTATAKATSRRNPSITLLRHLIDAIDNEEILTSDELREETLASIGRLLIVANLGNYFHAIVGENFGDYCAACRLRADAIKENHVLVERKPLRDIMADAALSAWNEDATTNLENEFEKWNL